MSRKFGSLDGKSAYLDDKTAMDRIHALLDGTEWDSDTVSEIADIIEFTGRDIRDPDDMIFEGLLEND